jgi:hypothetical protein
LHRGRAQRLDDVDVGQLEQQPDKSVTKSMRGSAAAKPHREVIIDHTDPSGAGSRSSSQSRARTCWLTRR